MVGLNRRRVLRSANGFGVNLVSITTAAPRINAEDTRWAQPTGAMQSIANGSLTRESRVESRSQLFRAADFVTKGSMSVELEFPTAASSR